MENPEEAEISEFTQPVDDDAATAMASDQASLRIPQTSSERTETRIEFA